TSLLPGGRGYARRESRNDPVPLAHERSASRNRCARPDDRLNDRAEARTDRPLVPMMYRLLADTTLVVHFAFVLFVVLGGLLVLRWRWVAWIHLPAVLWGAFVELTGRICPLTPLELWLRNLGGQRGYEGGFIE